MNENGGARSKIAFDMYVKSKIKIFNVKIFNIFYKVFNIKFFLTFRSMVAVKNYKESSNKFPVVCEVIPEENEKVLTGEISAIVGKDLNHVLMIVGLMLICFVSSLIVIISIKCKKS